MPDLTLAELQLLRAACTERAERIARRRIEVDTRRRELWTRMDELRLRLPPTGLVGDRARGGPPEAPPVVQAAAPGGLHATQDAVSAVCPALEIAVSAAPAGDLAGSR